ncbi:MAG: Arc family DNA-binding protein [Gemmatimonadales bacterium]
MAILNIKNMSDVLYRKLKARARREHRSVAQQVTYILEEALSKPGKYSILELKGLGKEHWREVDAVKHVAEERRAWD